MLTGEHGNKQRSIAYYSRQLDLATHAFPRYLKATTTAVKLIEASANLTRRNNIYLQTPYTVQSLLNSKLTQHFLQAD